ncbi:MAG: Ubiquinol-cytochrome c chaperone [Hyphomicrobiales bacterium]|nr:Ubiquinol-cytochrome c chaperone [Hyphomicrobiales bacterium]
MIFGLFRRSPNKALVDKLHGEIMAGVRQPALYLDLGVPDTFEGRFEMLALHGALVIRRLKAMAEPAPDLAQELTDGIFRHLDATLREMGVGDITVPKRMKKHAQAFAGRAVAYGEALDRRDEGALMIALARNVYGDETRATEARTQALARYVENVAAHLEARKFEDFLQGVVGFPAPARTGA